MVQATVTRAAAAFSRLCGYLGVLGWSTPHTRLVLFDVYVRSTMLFAAPVWAPLAVGTTFPGESAALEALHVLYRRGLRLMVGAPCDTRTSVLYTITARPPLGLPLGKAMVRYYSRLEDAMQVPFRDRGLIGVLGEVGIWAS